MTLPHFHRFGIVLVATAVLSAPLVLPAGANEPGQTLLAPFSCGTEWSGSTYGGHGLNDWNLDINRTSLVWPDNDYDLGQPILAQANGTVVWLEQTGYNSGAGAYLEVDYGDVTVRYIHLVEQSIPIEVAEIGSTVTTGQLLGELGGTGNASHPHLHLEYFDSTGYVDTPRWELPSTNQIKITMNGIEIEPGDAFVSTNCSTTTAPTTTIPFQFPFDDVDTDSFAYDDIALLAQLGVTTGTTPTTFEPGREVTREQMAAFLARLWVVIDTDTTELPSPIEQRFEDVTESSFAHDDIALLAHLAITTGTTETTFEPLLAVTREQMAAFLIRLWTLLDGGETPVPEPLYQPFNDVLEASFAYDHIAMLAYLELSTGTTPITFAPTEDVTREQMAAFLARLYRLLAPAEPEVPLTSLFR